MAKSRPRVVRRVSGRLLSLCCTSRRVRAHPHGLFAVCANIIPGRRAPSSLTETKGQRAVCQRAGDGWYGAVGRCGLAVDKVVWAQAFSLSLPSLSLSLSLSLSHSLSLSSYLSFALATIISTSTSRYRNDALVCPYMPRCDAN